MSPGTQSNLKHHWATIQDWLIIIAVGILMVRECIVVSSHLGQFSSLLGILSGAIFFALGGHIFGLLYRNLNKSQKALAFFLAGMTIVAVLTNAGAANAQFLQNAEDFFTAGADTFGLGEQVTLLVTLIFWIIRGAFVIGVAIALLPAIQAAREGDEWRSLAKTPMLVVGIVLAGATSVDFLVGGTAGG